MEVWPVEDWPVVPETERLVVPDVGNDGELLALLVVDEGMVLPVLSDRVEA